MKLCQIGCGEHARVAHGPSQARCARERGDLVLAGCCDLDPERAESFRREFGYARAFTDPAAMLEAERPDAVVAVVPVERTVAVGSMVLERGLPLLLEKPPGETVAEVDRLIAAADRGGRTVPHQVAFNRRFAPLVRELRRRIEEAGPLQHLHYEMTRVERRDPDFSTTAIHGLDAVRYLAGCDYAEARFRYREMPELGRGVANILVDAVMTSGATAHLAFCPVAGVLVERADGSRARPLALPPRPDVERRRLAGPALALRRREARGRRRRRPGRRRHRALRAGRLLPRDGRVPRRGRDEASAVAEPSRVAPVGGDRGTDPGARNGIPGLARGRTERRGA